MSQQGLIFGQQSRSKKSVNIPVIQPWVEKYRPKKIDQVISQEETVNTLKTSLNQGNLPHLLFYGPPGTGKTSTILALARDMFGAKNMKVRVLELNASDERGIDVIRHKVKSFAQHTVSINDKAPPFKIIILDEADSMTKDAQTALRRTMEVYTKMTRFCLICNYVSRIIEPLTSRCAKFRFKTLGTDLMTNHLNYICEQEGVNSSPEMFEELFKVSGGDMRKAINILQSCHRWKRKGAILPEDVANVGGAVPNSIVLEVFMAFKQGSFSDVMKCIDDLILNGYSAVAIIEQLHAHFMTDDSLTDVQKSSILLKLSEVDCALTEGADEELQLRTLGSTVMLATQS